MITSTSMVNHWHEYKSDVHVGPAGRLPRLPPLIPSKVCKPQGDALGFLLPFMAYLGWRCYDMF